MKRSLYLSLIKELTLEIKADKYSLILLMQRDIFIYKIKIIKKQLKILIQ